MLIRSAEASSFRFRISVTSSAVPPRMESRSSARIWIAPRTPRTTTYRSISLPVYRLNALDLELLIAVTAQQLTNEAWIRVTDTTWPHQISVSVCCFIGIAAIAGRSDRVGWSGTSQRSRPPSAGLPNPAHIGGCRDTDTIASVAAAYRGNTVDPRPAVEHNKVTRCPRSGGWRQLGAQQARSPGESRRTRPV